jgi:hypothetical protein
MLQYGEGLPASDKGIYEIRANRLASPFPAHPRRLLPRQVQQVGSVLTLDTEAFLIRCAEREGSNLTFDISLAVRGTAKSLKRYIGGHFGLRRTAAAKLQLSADEWKKIEELVRS